MTLATGMASQMPPQVVQLAGDPERGMSSTYGLDATKVEVIVLHKERQVFLTVDVYEPLPGEPLQIHLICPKCRKPLRISSDRKKIEWDHRAPSPIEAQLYATGMVDATKGGRHTNRIFGTLSVEAFECTWEVGDESHRTGILHSGLTLCRQRLVIDRNVARDA